MQENNLVNLQTENPKVGTMPQTDSSPQILISEQNEQQVSLGGILCSFDCLNHVYHFLSLVEQMKAQRVCQSFFRIFSTEIRWKQNCIIAQYPEKQDDETWRAHFMNHCFPCTF